MEQMIKLDITDASYEGLRCSVCTGYLSFAPIRWLPDGSALCGRCSPPNNVVPYGGFIVENLLSNATFPCHNKEFGCTANVKFNNALNHEDECIYRPFPCASLPYTSCQWKGSVYQVTSHFAEKHSNFVQQQAKIKLRIDQDEEGVLLVNENSGSFIVKYAFDSTISCLRYQIRFCMVGVVSQDCKLQFSNDFDPNFSVSLKAQCFAYNADLCNDSLVNVDVKPMLAVLNNPENATVVFYVKVPILPTESSQNNEVDYELLDSKRCARCQYFLVPPLFELKNEIICGDCSHVKDCKRATKTDLENLLTQKNFPCKWRGCNFIGKGDFIGRHQTECDFRIYSCPNCNCNTFKRNDLAEHMKSKHGYCYFSEKYLHTCSYTSDNKYIYTIVDNEIIAITICTIPINYMYFFNVVNANSNMMVIVYFSHDHCKCTSKKFSFSSNVSVHFSDLPKCFTITDNKTYATIKVKNY